MVGLDLDVAVLGGDLADQLDPLVDGEQALLRLIDHHHDVHDVVEPGSAGDDVEVSIGDGRITRTDGAAQLLAPLSGPVIVRLRT